MSVDTESPATGPDALARLTGLLDLVTPIAVRVAVTLRLPDLVAEGRTTAAKLAEASRADPHALAVLLRYLSTKDVFAEPSPGEFALTPLSEPLVAGHPSGLAGTLDLDAIGGRFDLAYSGLLGAVRTGTAGYPAVFGKGLWDDLAENPAVGASFDALMSVLAPFWVPEVVAARDWGADRHVVDVGGGTADLLTAVLRAHPGLRGTVVDLPPTAAKARQALAEAGLAERAEAVGGSFFDPLPPGGGVYVLAHVLHDWPDHEALRVLRRCAEAAGPTGRVVVVDRVVGGQPGDPAEAVANLHMLVMFGGRERTAAQFADLASAAGLRVTSTSRTSTGSAVLDCVPA